MFNGMIKNKVSFMKKEKKKKYGRVLPFAIALFTGICSAGILPGAAEAEAAGTIDSAEGSADTDPVWLHGYTAAAHPELVEDDASSGPMFAPKASVEDIIFSEQYMGSPYYQNLLEAKSTFGNKSILDRVLAVGMSQEGYLNYAVMGDDPAELTAQNLLWTGLVQRNNSRGTGNSEYTRWAYNYFLGAPEYECYDSDWCAFFTSWCLYQAGYYSEKSLKAYYYSSCADPRVESPGKYATSFNFDQNKVWYAPVADYKLQAYAGWNTFVNTDIDPYEIPWKPGGMVFFTWTEGAYFDHVGIVQSYDPETHVLRYLNGNSAGKVRVSSMDFDMLYGYTEENDDVPIYYSDTIMAYAEYDSHDALVVGSWHKNKTGWWYSDSTGWYPTNQWMMIDGYWYHFNKYGYMDHDCYIDGRYIRSNGMRDNDTTYTWYHNRKGWWYSNENYEYPHDGWTLIDGVWYYFKEDGFMARNEWVDGYWLKNSGAWTYRYRGSWRSVDDKWKYADTSGWYAVNESMKIDGVIYEFDEEGFLIGDPPESLTQ